MSRPNEKFHKKGSTEFRDTLYKTHMNEQDNVSIYSGQHSTHVVLGFHKAVSMCFTLIEIHRFRQTNSEGGGVIIIQNKCLCNLRACSSQGLHSVTTLQEDNPFYKLSCIHYISYVWDAFSFILVQFRTVLPLYFFAESDKLRNST